MTRTQLSEQTVRVSDDEPIEVGRLDPAEWLGRSVKVTIDRPLGSQHPEGGFVYELNYGFVPGYIAPDGEELDAYVIGPDVPLTEYEGEIIAVVLRDDDVEDKVVVGSRHWTESEVTKAIRLQERFFTSRVVMRP